MITLYTIHCPACIVLEKKLNAKNLTYDIVDDETKLTELGITQFPMLEIDGKMYTYSEAVKIVNSY